MGQWLSIPLILAGIALVIWAVRRPPLGGGGNAAEVAAKTKPIEAQPVEE
jgi:phosphatidylglycerol:prolipoprotein diacylglycerol transferase